MARVRGLLVTGTDTGIGKTQVACGLAAWLRRQGVDVGVMKPVATGGKKAGRRWISEDALALKAACGANDPLTLINPVCFKEPLAPLTAANRAKQPINYSQITKTFHQLASLHDFILVEGVGGLLVPLTASKNVSDLAVSLALPVVIVARPGLGTLNHTLLTLEAARRKGLTVAGVIINHVTPIPKDPMARLAMDTNPAMIKQQGKVAITGILPYQSNRTVGALTHWIGKHMNKQWLHRWLL